MPRDIEATMWKLGPNCAKLPDWARSHVGKDILPGDGFLTLHTPAGEVRVAEGDFLVRVQGEARLFYITAADVAAGMEARDKRPIQPIGSAEGRVN